MSVGMYEVAFRIHCNTVSGSVCTVPLCVARCALYHCVWQGVHCTTVCGTVCTEPLCVARCALYHCVWHGVHGRWTDTCLHSENYFIHTDGHQRHLVLKKFYRHFINLTGVLQTAVTKSCEHTAGCVCVIFGIVTLPEDEPNNGPKHAGV
jgi:hypothetical protein